VWLNVSIKCTWTILGNYNFKNVNNCILLNRLDAKFSAPVHIGFGDHPASCRSRYRVSFLGTKQQGRGVDYPLPSTTVWAIPLLTLWDLMACYSANFVCFCFTVLNKSSNKICVGIKTEKLTKNFYIMELHRVRFWETWHLITMQKHLDFFICSEAPACLISRV